MPDKDPIRKKPKIKLPDLTPKKDAQGGRLGYSGNPPLRIPPPGFLSTPKGGSAERQG